MAETLQQIRKFGWMYAVLGIVAVVGGVYSLNNRINGIAPYLFSLDTTPFGESEAKNQDRLQELAALQALDSDSDGLSDFDEQYVHYSSAYLTDTDSDGQDDYAEVQQGTDPTCFEGQECNQVRALVGVTDETTTTLAAGEEVSVLQGDNLTPEAVKTELEKMGIPAYTFANVDDEDLVEVYKSVTNQFPELDAASTTDYSSTTDISVEEITAQQGDSTYQDLVYNTTEAQEGSFAGFSNIQDFRNLDVSQIRSLLLQSGVSGDELDALGDEELLALYNQVLEEQLAAAE